MTDQELIAKTVFGEITLGEVLNKFESKISWMEVEYDGREAKYESWVLEDGDLQLFGEWEMEVRLPLDSKAKIREDSIEVEYEGENFTFTFIESKTVRFDSLLPGGDK